MADYVLVHGGNMTTGTWNQLTTGSPVQTPDGTMGGMIWDPVIPALHAQGHLTFAPTLTDENTTTLTGHIGEIEKIITDNDLRDVILTGHSYGGMIITGVAARLPERIRHLVYVDAAVPDPGHSLFDEIIASGSDPQSFAGLVLAAPYVEKLEFDARAIQLLKKTCIRCTKSDFSAVTLRAWNKIAAAGPQWTCLELPSSHVPMAEMPDRIARVLLDAAKN
jgi:pimeloyl-ACP methyl ester carboxylesterase